MTTRTLRQSRKECGRSVAGALALAVALSGCASLASRSTATDARGSATVQELANFYWQYAGLAADVYSTEGNVDTDRNVALSSPWLRDAVRRAHDPSVDAWYNSLARGAGGPPTVHPPSSNGDCASGDVTPAAMPAPQAGEPTPAGGASLEIEFQAPETSPLPISDRYLSAEPTDKSHCEISSCRRPRVPLLQAMNEFGWHRATEFPRTLRSRGWSFFVPHLAVDIWRRALPPAEGRAVLEYAIVFRGTVGGGGWLSNLRALTGFTPLIWDQYHQSVAATRSVVDQIRKLHETEAAGLGKAPEVRYTVVGHSLGAGLAKFAFLVIPEVSRVIGFDPSPVDGSSMIRIDSRPKVMGHPHRRTFAGEHMPPASIYFLQEHGEALGVIRACDSGPIWGAEGGPVQECHSVNFSSGNPFRQHSMPQLACKLYLVRNGIAPR
jgi:hypothetical protein